MASRNSKQVLNLDAVSAQVAEHLSQALYDGFSKLFFYRYNGEYNLKKTLAEEALAQAILKKEAQIADEVQRLMGEGLYRMIAQLPAPSGFQGWGKFNKAYRENIALPQMGHSALKVRRWLARNGYRSYRDYMRDRAYVNKLTSGDAETLLRKAAREERPEGRLKKSVTLGNSRKVLLEKLTVAAEKARTARHKELLRDRIQRVRRGNLADLAGKDAIYGLQSGEFARKFRELPVEFNVRLGSPNTRLRTQVRAVAQALKSLQSPSRSDASRVLESALQVELIWDEPPRMPRSMQNLLRHNKSRFRNNPNFPLYNPNYAAKALEQALRQVFADESEV